MPATHAAESVGDSGSGGLKGKGERGAEGEEDFEDEQNEGRERWTFRSFSRLFFFVLSSDGKAKAAEGLRNGKPAGTRRRLPREALAASEGEEEEEELARSFFAPSFFSSPASLFLAAQQGISGVTNTGRPGSRNGKARRFEEEEEEEELEEGEQPIAARSCLERATLRAAAASPAVALFG